jgi:hypothetical protein
MQSRSFLVELPSPEPASSRFILPWRSSSSEFLRSNLPRASFDGRIPTQGLVPHRGNTGARPHLAKDAMPSLRSVLRLSQPLDGLLRSPALQACSIPQPRPGLSPFRGFSSRAARLLHQQPMPPCRCHPEHSPDLALRFAFAFRLPPDATLVDASASRPSSARDSVAYGLGLASPQPAPLFGFHLLQVVNHRLGFGSPKPPLTTFVVLSVFQRRARSLSFPRNQPARDFRAFRLKSPW